MTSGLCRGQAGAVDDDEDVRARAPGCRAEARPVGDVVRQELEELVDRLGDEARRADASLARAEGVRQPLEPVPLGARVGADQGGDDERVGRVHHSGVDDERPREARAGRPRR